jgi:hypothetical protein
MGLNDFFRQSEQGLNSGGVLVIDGSGSETGAVEIHEVFASGPIEMRKEVDTNGDGSFNLSVVIESLDSPFHSQKNQIEVSQSKGVRVKIVNTDSSNIDCAVNGIEVSN